MLTNPHNIARVLYNLQGQSALFDVLDGDAEKQIEALYHYILQGNKMNPPEVPGQ